jgi:hypothetical protein
MLEVNCFCIVANQHSSAGEKELFTRQTTKMPSASRTRQSTQEMLVVVFPPLNIRPEYLQDSGSSFEFCHRPRHHCGWPSYVAHRRIMTGWSILAQHMLSWERACLRAKTQAYTFAKSHLVPVSSWITRPRRLYRYCSLFRMVLNTLHVVLRFQYQIHMPPNYIDCDWRLPSCRVTVGSREQIAWSELTLPHRRELVECVTKRIGELVRTTRNVKH